MNLSMSKCASKALARRFLTDDNLKNEDFRVENEEQANEIFHFIYTDPEFRTTDREIYKEVNKKLKITEMIIINQFWNAQLIHIIHGQTLKRLEVRVGDLYTHLSLSEIFCKKSSKTLRSFSLEGIKFTAGWIQFLHNHFPLLKHLRLRQCLADNGFLKLCDVFRGITKLDIHGASLTSLQGISNLQQLEILLMGGVNVEKSDGMMELFELKKLRVLDMGWYLPRYAIPKEDPPYNFPYLPECGKILPELRFIDLSQNLMDPGWLHNLVERHEKLECVGLIAAKGPRGRRPLKKPAIRDVKYLCTDSVADCYEALKFYCNTGGNPHDSVVYDIMSALKNLLEPAFSSEKDARRCYEVFLTILHHPHQTIEIHFAILSFLDIFLSLKPIKYITREEVSSFPKIILDILKNYKFSGIKYELECVMYITGIDNVWKMTIEYEILAITFVVEIMEHITICDSEATRECLDMIKLFIEHNRTSLRNIYRNYTSLKPKLAQLLTTKKFNELEDGLDLLNEYICIITNLIKWDTEDGIHASPNLVECQKECLRAIMEKTDDFEENIPVETHIFHNLTEIVRIMDHRALYCFFNKDDVAFKQLLLFLNTTFADHQYQMLALDLLLHIIRRIYYDLRTTNGSFLQYHEHSMKFILEAIKPYVKEVDAGLMEIWKWIEDQECSPKMKEAKDLARLFMRAYEKENGSEGEKEEGPAVKIPRIQ